MADKMTSKEIAEKVAKVVNSIANQENVESFGSLMRNHFKSITSLSHLSWNNQMLAILQGATGEVKTFRQWKAAGRFVRRGETSHITLIRPIRVKKGKKDDEDDKGFTFFTGYAVFDIGQTETDQPIFAFDYLVDCVERKMRPVEEIYLEQLYNVCDTMGITVREMALRRGLYGYSSGGAITLAVNLNTAQKISTLTHEIAHEILHQSVPFDQRDEVTKERWEYEAEMSAAVLMDYFGLDNRFSAAYVKMYGADSEKITATMKAVQNAVSTILKAMEKVEDTDEAGLEIAA